MTRGDLARELERITGDDVIVTIRAFLDSTPPRAEVEVVASYCRGVAQALLEPTEAPPAS